MSETGKQPEPPKCRHCGLTLKIDDTYCTRCNTFRNHWLALKAFFRKPEFYIVFVGLLLSMLQVVLAFHQGNLAKESGEKIQKGITQIDTKQNEALAAVDTKQTDALKLVEANLKIALSNIQSQQEESVEEIALLASMVDELLPVRWDFVLKETNGLRLAKGVSSLGEKADFNENEACVLEDLNTLQNLEACKNQVNAFCIDQYKEKYPGSDNFSTLNVAGIFITTAGDGSFGIVCFNRPPSQK